MNTAGRTRFGFPTTRRAAVLAGLAGFGSPLLAACGIRAPGGEGRPKLTGPATIEFMHRWEGVREKLVEAQVRAFEAKQPQIKINNQLVFGSGEGFRDGMPYDKIFAMVVAGTPPDVFMVGSETAADFAFKGALEPIDTLLKRDKLDPLKVFYPALAKMAQREGKTYGLPQLTGGDRPYVFWNVEAYQAAGLDPNRAPQNWDQIVEFSQRLTKREGGGFSRLGLPFPGAPFIDWLTRNDGKLLADDATKALFDSPAGVETLQFMVDSTNRLYGSSAALGEFMSASRAPGTGGARAPHYTGKSAMWISGVWHFFEAKQESPNFNPSFKMGVGLVPHNTKKAGAKNLSLVDKVWLYAVAKGSKKIDGSWEWLKYITADEGNKTFVLAQARPSPALKNNEDPAFQRENPHWNTVVLKALELAHPLPQTPAWPRIQGVLDRMPGQVLTGQKGVKEALTEAQQEAQRLLDEVKR